MNPLLLVLLAYLLGSVPTSHWVGRGVFGVDLRKRGSGNLGATNTFRVLGWKAAVVVVTVDVAKGFVPAWAFPLLDAPETAWSWAMAYGAAAVLGHVFSVFNGFRGGKGVATSGGVFLGLAPWAVLAAFVAWLGVVLVSRIVSLASIAAAVTAPVAVWFTPHRGTSELPLFTLALAAFIVWAHRSNIGRLLRGEEGRIAPPRAREAGGEGAP